MIAINALTKQEKKVYRLALANVQEQLAQGMTLDPNAHELNHVNQSEIPLQPVNWGYTIGTGGPQLQARTRYAREGSSEQGGSRRLTPEHHSPSPMAGQTTLRQPGGIPQGRWTVMWRMETLMGSTSLPSQAVPRARSGDSGP
jgi:hypothetical protein